MTTMRGPARRPCGSCPYRRDVPSGVWAAPEYALLAEYDGPTWAQPAGALQCHQGNPERVCAGWASVHGDDQSLALRLAARGTPVRPGHGGGHPALPLTGAAVRLGRAAARHGLADLAAMCDSQLPPTR